MRYIILIVFLLFSCQKKETSPQLKDNEELVTMNQISMDYDTLTNRVKFKGDTLAYDELFYHLMDSDEISRTDTLMYYSKIMAEKYNNEKAFLDYFKAFCEKNSIYIDYPHYNRLDISRLPVNSKKEAEDWLNKMLDKKIITEEQFNSVKR